MKKYHHLGIPTREIHPHEIYHEALKFFHAGFEESEYGVEWMRFLPDCPLPELVKTVPHVAFEVDNLETELEGKETIIAPNSPSPGVRVAFVVENGAPIELIEINKK
jgi:hypothetical protein